jgi:agmatinase
MSPPRYGPPDAWQAPRYTGVRTFARCPLIDSAEGVDVAAIGVPFDTATSNRPGARFGPEAIRACSIALRPYHPALDVDVFAALSVADLGDLNVTPGNAERTAAQIAEGLEPVVSAGTIPLVLGGDHSIVLGELRAHAARHGPLALVLLDAHSDTWDQYYGERYFHGTPFRRAVEEGLLRPERSVMAGMRGPLYSASDLAEAREMGFELIGGDELRKLSPADYGRRVRERVGEAPAFFSFDIDVIDPAFAPGTGTPEPGGMTTIDLLWACREIAASTELTGFEIVEVIPTGVGSADITSLAADRVVREVVTGMALARRRQG